MNARLRIWGNALKILSLLLMVTIISVQSHAVAHHEAELETDSASKVVESEEQETVLVDNGDAGDEAKIAGEQDNGSIDSSTTENDVSTTQPVEDGGNSTESDTEDSGDSSSPSEDNGDSADNDGGDTSNPSSGDSGDTQSGEEAKEPSDDNPPHTMETIPATDIDIGDITSITLGTSQILAVTLIPTNSTDTVSYTSLTPDVASVNGLGRVKALALGTARVQIDAGTVSRIISISIVPEEQEETKEPIPATAIDVSYEETMSMDTSQILSVSLLPSDSDSTIRYSSNTPAIASVNEFGRVTATAAGIARITISAGNARKTIEITVKNDTEVQEMDFGDVPAEMTVGDSQNLTVSILPTEASNQTVTYRSSDSGILEVNPFGRIVAKKPGTATITAQSGRAHCSVTITVKEEIKVEKMDFGDVPAEMTIGASQVLNVSILPTEAANQTVAYRSSNPDILEVNPFGRVTAKAIGTATVTAQSGDADCSVTITVKPEIKVEQMDFGDVPAEITVGASQNLNVSILPAEASNRSVSYYSSEPDILEVNSFGRVIAKNPGIAVITAESDDVTCSITITVVEQVRAKEIEFNDAQTEMVLGTSQTLNVGILPSEAANKTIVYNSSNPDVLDVNPFGRVNAVNIGAAIITASVDGVSNSITIEVKPKIVPNDIDFEKPDSELLLGASVNLGASVLPTNAENQTISYTSSDPAVLTVNAAGKITGRSLGTATISMTAGEVLKSVTISVVEEIKVNTIEVSEFNKKMKVDATQTLSTSVFPTDAKEQKISFSSSNPSVASVSEGGVITAKSAGNAVITLKAGNAIKKLDLTVYIATDEIQIPENYLILHPSDQYQVFKTVKPSGADQKVSYRSTDTNVATVSKDGMITALSAGRTSIILENDDAMATITVIVNNGNVAAEPQPDTPVPVEENKESYLAEAIRKAGNQETITESGSQCPFVTNDVLLALYQTEKKLKIAYDDYNITIKGNSIRNVKNEFSTEIQMWKTSDVIPDSVAFAISEGHNLPGDLEIEFLNLEPEYRFLYLYNAATKEYERLNMENGHRATIGMSGEYLITTKKIRKNRWPIYGSIAGGGLLIVGIGVYISTKKQYWFW